jgi:hypothetical protein
MRSPNTTPARTAALRIKALVNASIWTSALRPE